MASTIVPKILRVGAATLDTIFRLDELPRAAGKYLPLEAVEIAAGMASSAALAAARLGASVSLCARVGDDRQGRQLVDDYTGEGLDCRHVRTVPGARTAFSTILVDRSGDRIIVPRYDPALMADLAGLPIDDLASFDVVLVDVRWPTAGEAILDAARLAGVPTVLDADVAAPAVLARLVPLASHCVFSEPAALAYTGCASASAALDVLADCCPAAFMAVTVGPDGCWWIDKPAGKHRREPAPQVTVVDTLSAGDVFHGAFGVALAEGRPMPDAIRFANAAAALKCTRFGGRLGAPKRGEVDAFLRTNGMPMA